jgi:hypothetical protein
MTTPGIWSWFVALLIATALNSCQLEEICTRGQGGLVDSTLSVPRFTGFDFRTKGRVFLRQGPTPSVRVVGQANIIDKLKFEVENQTWSIDLKGCVRDYEPLEFYLTLPEIDYIRVSGSGSVVADSLITADDLNLLLSGSGSIDLDLTVDFLYTKITGSGDITLDAEVATNIESQITGSGTYFLSGTASDHRAKILGSGDIKAFALRTLSTWVKLSGAGDAEVRASEALSVDISGSGNVSYRGNPSLEIEITGSGKVVDAN